MTCAAYIAALDPQTVLALLDALAASDRALLVAAGWDLPMSGSALMTVLDAIAAARERVAQP